MLDDRDILVQSQPATTAAPPPLKAAHASPVMKPGEDQIKIKIRREQVTGITGKVTFSVNFIAELSPAAKEAVRRYGFGKTVLYQKTPQFTFTMNVPLILWRTFKLWLTRRRWQITVNDIVNGRTMDCKDILHVLEVEEHITESAKMFASILRTASWFGGEEIVEL